MSVHFPINATIGIGLTDLLAVDIPTPSEPCAAALSLRFVFFHDTNVLVHVHYPPCGDILLLEMHIPISNTVKRRVSAIFPREKLIELLELGKSEIDLFGIAMFVASELCTRTCSECGLQVDCTCPMQVTKPKHASDFLPFLQIMSRNEWGVFQGVGTKILREWMGFQNVDCVMGVRIQVREGSLNFAERVQKWAWKEWIKVMGGRKIQMSRKEEGHDCYKKLIDLPENETEQDWWDWATEGVTEIPNNKEHVEIVNIENEHQHPQIHTNATIQEKDKVQILEIEKSKGITKEDGNADRKLEERRLKAARRREKNRLCAQRSNLRAKLAREKLIDDLKEGKEKVEQLRKIEMQLRRDNLIMKKQLGRS